MHRNWDDDEGTEPIRLNSSQSDETTESLYFAHKLAYRKVGSSRAFKRRTKHCFEVQAHIHSMNIDHDFIKKHLAEHFDPILKILIFDNFFRNIYELKFWYFSVNCKNWKISWNYCICLHFTNTARLMQASTRENLISIEISWSDWLFFAK